jgi:hypothetical protein
MAVSVRGEHPESSIKAASQTWKNRSRTILTKDAGGQEDDTEKRRRTNYDYSPASLQNNAS